MGDREWGFTPRRGCKTPIAANWPTGQDYQLLEAFGVGGQVRVCHVPGVSMEEFSLPPVRLGRVLVRTSEVVLPEDCGLL